MNRNDGRYLVSSLKGVWKTGESFMGHMTIEVSMEELVPVTEETVDTGGVA